MTTFVLVPGAGGAGTVYWADVIDELAARGHTGLAVEIAGDDPALGLPEYAAITDKVIGEHRDVVLVAQSLGGFTVPMVGKRDQLSRIVLLNAMIPVPDETPGGWWDATGQPEAYHLANVAAGRADDFDVDTVFLHDIPAERREAMAAGDREPAPTPFAQKCAFVNWPDVPIHVLVGADDRMFPRDFQVRVARERLGVDADVMPGGHLVAKSRPAEVAERLVGYAGDGGRRQ